MTDIQNSLRRLQESIRGLSDASALIGSVGDDSSNLEVEGRQRRDSNPAGGIFDDTSPLCSRIGTAATSASEGARNDDSNYLSGYRSLSASSSFIASKNAGNGERRLEDDDQRLSESESRSFNPRLEQQLQDIGVRESAEVCSLVFICKQVFKSVALL